MDIVAHSCYAAPYPDGGANVQSSFQVRIFCYKQRTRKKNIKKVSSLRGKMVERQGGPLPIFGERPALAQLISATDVDEAAEEEDAAEPASDKSAPADTATNADDEPADDQHQVNSEAPATRLVNVERPPCRRPRASITTPIISTSNTFLSLSLQSFAPDVMEIWLPYGLSTAACQCSSMSSRVRWRRATVNELHWIPVGGVAPADDSCRGPATSAGEATVHGGAARTVPAYAVE